MSRRNHPHAIERNAALDAELARLTTLDLEPLLARTQLLAAQRRLAAGGTQTSRFDRIEPALLVAFASAHLIWALARILELAFA